MEHLYQTQLLPNGDDTFDPLEYITDPMEIDIREHELDRVQWGHDLSNYTMEKWQVALLKEMIEEVFRGLPVRIVFNHRFPNESGEFDCLVFHRLPDGHDEQVILSLELNNLGSCTWIPDKRSLGRWTRLESIAKKGIIKLHPDYIRAHLMAGGHKQQYCMHPTKHGFSLFRMTRMISNRPSRKQRRTLRSILTVLKKKVMALIHPPRPTEDVYYKGIELLDIRGIWATGVLDTTTHSTETIEADPFKRFSGS